MASGRSHSTALPRPGSGSVSAGEFIGELDCFVKRVGRVMAALRSNPLKKMEVRNVQLFIFIFSDNKFSESYGFRASGARGRVTFGAVNTLLTHIKRVGVFESKYNHSSAFKFKNFTRI